MWVVEEGLHVKRRGMVLECVGRFAGGQFCGLGYFVIG